MMELGKKAQGVKILEEVLELAASIDSSKILISISKVLLKIGNEEQSVKVIEEALDVANTISDEVEKSRVLANIAEVMIELGKEEQGVKILEETLEIIKHISHDQKKSAALLFVLKSYLRETLRVIFTSSFLKAPLVLSFTDHFYLNTKKKSPTPNSYVSPIFAPSSPDSVKPQYSTPSITKCVRATPMSCTPSFDNAQLDLDFCYRRMQWCNLWC